MVRWVGDGGREIRRGPDVDVDAALEESEASRMASSTSRTERTTLSCTTARHERRSSLNVFGEFISWKFFSVVDFPDSLWPVRLRVGPPFVSITDSIENETS